MSTRAAYLSFPSTHWSVVLSVAGQKNPEARAKAIAELVQVYSPALLAFLQSKKGLDRHRAEDVLQDFVADKVLGQGLIARAERGRGKFRNFLLKSLQHFLYNQVRRNGAAFRGPPQDRLSVSVDTHAVADPSPPPHMSFDVAWARNVLALALEAMQRECVASARPDVWAVFDGRVLGPTLRGDPPAPYVELVERYRYASPAQASNVLITANRMFARCLRAVVGNYAASEDDLEEELRDLRTILASAGAQADPRWRLGGSSER